MKAENLSLGKDYVRKNDSENVYTFVQYDSSCGYFFQDKLNVIWFFDENSVKELRSINSNSNAMRFLINFLKAILNLKF
jgi:hypothetical protein